MSVGRSPFDSVWLMRHDPVCEYWQASSGCKVCCRRCDGSRNAIVESLIASNLQVPEVVIIIFPQGVVAILSYQSSGFNQ
jgi:hypothetical protein